MIFSQLDTNRGNTSLFSHFKEFNFFIVCDNTWEQNRNSHFLKIDVLPPYYRPKFCVSEWTQNLHVAIILHAEFDCNASFFWFWLFLQTKVKTDKTFFFANSYKNTLMRFIVFTMLSMLTMQSISALYKNIFIQNPFFHRFYSKYILNAVHCKNLSNVK